MRILQLIDTLRTGGAERVAVNVANTLVNKIEYSFLCITRQEGLLKSSINEEVEYVFLNKKSAIDVFALMKLLRFVKKHRIDIIHAHSTSFLFATIIKWMYPSVKIIWHDHYGKSEFLGKRKVGLLKFCSKYFSGILSVNSNLEQWSLNNLNCREVSCLPNYAVKGTISGDTILKGNNGKRILSLANLRPQKDHITLLNAFKLVSQQFPDLTLHCVGLDLKDEYSEKVYEKLNELDLENKAFFYGSKEDIGNIIQQSDICVLSSKSEGLPIALLEYGLFEKPVLVTDVGDSGIVVKHKKNGLIIEKENEKTLAESLSYLINNKEIAKEFGENLKQTIEEKFSEEKYINNLIKIYNSL
jgi:glycosyltransferase involved in cell wall biosynthesis